MNSKEGVSPSKNQTTIVPALRLAVAKKFLHQLHVRLGGGFGCGALAAVEPKLNYWFALGCVAAKGTAFRRESRIKSSDAKVGIFMLAVAAEDVVIRCDSLDEILMNVCARAVMLHP